MKEISDSYSSFFSTVSTPLYDEIVRGKNPNNGAGWQHDRDANDKFYTNLKMLDSKCPGSSIIIGTKGIPSDAVNSSFGTPFQYRAQQHLINFKEQEKICNAKDATFKQLSERYDLNALLSYLRAMPGFNLHMRNGELRSKLKLPASITSYDSMVALVEEADHAFALKAQKNINEKSRLNRFFAPPPKAGAVNLLAAPHDPDPHGLKELFGAPSGGAPRGGSRKTRNRRHRHRSAKNRKIKRKSHRK
jgi:hypothetical protein